MFLLLLDEIHLVLLRTAWKNNKKITDTWKRVEWRQENIEQELEKREGKFLWKNTTLQWTRIQGFNHLTFWRTFSFYWSLLSQPTAFSAVLHNKVFGHDQHLEPCEAKTWVEKLKLSSSMRMLECCSQNENENPNRIERASSKIIFEFWVIG